MRKDSLTSKSAWAATASALMLGGRFAASVLIARLLGPTDTGRFAYTIWLGDLAIAVAGMGLQTALTRYLAEANGRLSQPATAGLVRWIAWRFGAATLTGAAMIWGAIQVSNSTLLDSIGSLLVLYFALQALSTFYLALLGGIQDFRTSAAVNLASTITLVVSSAILSVQFGLQGALLAYCAGAFVPTCFLLRALVDLPSGPQPGPALRRKILRFGGYSWLAALVTVVVWTRAEIGFLANFTSPRTVALFSVAASLAGIASQGPTLLSAALMPHFASAHGANDIHALQSGYARATRVLAFGWFPICLMFAASTYLLVPSLYGAEYSPATPAATILIAASVLSVANVGSALLYGLERSRFVALGGLLGALLTVGGCLYAVPRWGLMGAVWVRVAVQSSMIALGTWYIMRRLAFTVPLQALWLLLIASISPAAVLWLSGSFWGPLGLVGAVAPALAIYFALVWLLRPLDKQDLCFVRAAVGGVAPRIAARLSHLFGGAP